MRGFLSIQNPEIVQGFINNMQRKNMACYLSRSIRTVSISAIENPFVLRRIRK